MKVPEAKHSFDLKMIPFEIREMLEYVVDVATTHEGLGYDCDKDQVIYHIKVDNMDREVFPALLGFVDEVWVIQAGINIQES